MAQIDDIQAQLGNLLSGLPSKVQKVDSSFLELSTPPFEGAIVSDANGQFYISDSDSDGNIAWKVVKDVTARQENLAEDAAEVVLKFDVPEGFQSGTIGFGATFIGGVSVFVQYEAPASADFVMYVTAVNNITSTGFDLHFSEEVSEGGGTVHILAKGTEGVAQAT
jgi:hypothetical protein